MKIRLVKQFAIMIVMGLASEFSAVASGNAPLTYQSATNIVASVKNCIGPSFNGDAISIHNICTEPIAATWFFGNGHQGFASLAAGESAPTGVSAPEIPQLGVLRFFACPASHPAFLAPGGGFLTSPSTNFSCGLPHNNFSGNGPRAFHYDVLTSGDCVLEKGTLTFNASGQGMWQAHIHTNRTMNRDIWHISFAVLDGSGHSLFPINPGDSPAMYGSPSPVIPWGTPFSFNASQFGSIQNIQVSMSC